MDKATLVGLDIEAGSAVISSLQKAGVDPKVALWLVTPEYEDGRLVIASPALDQTDIRQAYEKLVEILRGQFVHELPLIMVLRMKDPFIKTLRQIFSKTKSVEGMRLGGQSIGNRFVSDAYVYRIQ